MSKVSLKVRSLLTDYHHAGHEVYTFNETDTLSTVIDHLSVKYNYNFFIHFTSISSTKDNICISVQIKDKSISLKELNLGSNIYLNFSMTPRFLESNIDKGYKGSVNQ